MNAADIKKRLFKPATIFETGGFRPTEELGESWIGAVMWGQPGEVTPPNYDPLFTLFLKDLEHVPEAIRDFELITVSVDKDVFDRNIWDTLELGFHINCYRTLDGLTMLNSRSSQIKAFPLIPQLIQNDTPSWDDEIHMPPDLMAEILAFERTLDIDYFGDIVEIVPMGHKVGGYPSLLQGGMDIDEGYAFVFEISSDGKARFNIVDRGNFYFYYNREKDSWKVRCDFY